MQPARRTAATYCCRRPLAAHVSAPSMRGAILIVFLCRILSS